MTNPKQTKELAPTRDEDEVLRRMLATKPTPHKAPVKKAVAKKLKAAE